MYVQVLVFKKKKLHTEDIVT